jgi:hypothetical protein
MPPSFYEKHFSQSLVLQRVERLPSLVQALADNVETALQAASGHLPPLDNFITAKDRKRDLGHLEVGMHDEGEVAKFYDRTTAKFCLPLASTLALHPTASFSQWASLLFWTQSVNYSSGHAITDGVLRFFGESGLPTMEKIRSHIVEGMENDKRRIFEKMRESQSPLATWEITGPSTGPVEAMTAVLGQFLGRLAGLQSASRGLDIRKQSTESRRCWLALTQKLPRSISLCVCGS